MERSRRRLTEIPEGLLRSARGHEAFRRMLASWMKRSGFSLATLSDLAELAMIQREAPNVPAAAAGPYQPGDVVLHRGHVWQAQQPLELVEVNGELDGPRFSEVEQLQGTWAYVAAVRRVHASQVNQLVRGDDRKRSWSKASPSTSFFDALGVLNEWLSDLRVGRAPAPADQKLAERAREAMVISDADGPFGPQEMFAVYVGLLEPPTSVTSLTAEQAAEASRVLAKRIRQGLMAAGLDILDDWPRFLSCYPTTDRNRLSRIRDVAMGLANWSPEEVADEEAAVNLALQRLLSRGSSAQPRPPRARTTPQD